MRAVLTKVQHASVTIDGTVKGKIGKGFLILLGVAPVSYTHLTLPTTSRV